MMSYERKGLRRPPGRAAVRNLFHGMRTPVKLDAMRLGLLVLLVYLGGCTANKVTSQWRDGDIITNGSDSEWRVVPQYYDGDRPVAIRVTNDAKALFLCISTSDEAVKRQLRMTGLTLWFDPQGEKNRIFGIHLPGSEPPGPRRGARPEAGGMPPARNRGGASPDKEPILPPVGPLNELSITYSDATGPLTMTLDEVRHTGIDIGVGQPPGGRLVYEFAIAFKAAPSLCGLAPGMVVGLGVLAGTSGKQNPKRSTSGGETGPGGPGGPGGGMRGPGPGNGGTMSGGPMGGGGPGGPGPGEKSESLAVWLQVRLADRTPEQTKTSCE
jgi:hypothetical protein